MAIVSLREVDAGYGGALLLDKAELNIERGERICLLGRNGSGKSTLLKLISGEFEPLDGGIEFQKGLKIGGLLQEVPAAVDKNVFDIVADGLGIQGKLLCEYFDLSHSIAAHQNSSAEMLGNLSARIESLGGWQLNQKINTVLTRMSLDGAASFASLSAGVKRRVMLARAIVDMPDLLLLDEPTNHLDIDSIRWLEDYLIGSGVTLLFVTHDREFLKRLATRIIELDRGRLMSFDCDYDKYLARRKEILDAQAAQWEHFDKKLAEEEVWIRKGIQARRTRNEGRVRALKAMREERRSRRNAAGTAKMTLQQAGRSGELIAEAKGVCFGYDPQRPIIKDFTATIMRGDKIGILGPNGIGKTTLLNLLLGTIVPQQGTLRLGTNIEICYFDQLHNQLDENKSVVDNVADGYKTIQIDGKPRSVIGYLNDFLFLPVRANSLVSSLSGGERSRLLLARVFAKPSNLLVLDEPTNNLDVETLELLEELLQNYSGTILTVSHDRAFLNNTVTDTLVFEGGGTIKQYVGGYDDYLRQSLAAAAEIKQQTAPEKKQYSKQSTKRKLSYNEKKELQTLPAKIENLDAAIADIHEKMASPSFYKQAADDITSTTAKLQVYEDQLAAAYARWEELEAIET